MRTILQATRIFIFIIQLAMIVVIPAKGQVLKSIVYDFDGLDIGATDLPEGDYVSGDCFASVSANPLPPVDMLGDRCMKHKWLAIDDEYMAANVGEARRPEVDAVEQDGTAVRNRKVHRI